MHMECRRGDCGWTGHIHGNKNQCPQCGVPGLFGVIPDPCLEGTSWRQAKCANCGLDAEGLRAEFVAQRELEATLGPIPLMQAPPLGFAPLAEEVLLSLVRIEIQHPRKKIRCNSCRKKARVTRKARAA